MMAEDDPVDDPVGVQKDLFVCTLGDVSLRADRVTLEFPFFALKAGQQKFVRNFRNGDAIEVRGGELGRATIFDKEILLFCVSQLSAAKKSGIRINSNVIFKAYDFFIWRGSHVGGDAYRRLKNSLLRLSETRILTNIKTGGEHQIQSFGFIESFALRYHENDYGIKIKISDFLFRAISAMEILYIPKSYFDIRSPLARRVFEVLRKHLGDQEKFSIFLETLHHKSGAECTLKEFRRAIRNLAVKNNLPRMQIFFDSEKDKLSAYAFGIDGSRARLRDIQNHHKN